MNRNTFEHEHPGAFFLDQNDTVRLEEYLKQRQWIGSAERVRNICKAGEGNMNCTLRVRTDVKSFILKQSRPWVEKYPHISAPWDRALTEGAFYQVTATESFISKMMPKLLGMDQDSRILAFEDLGFAQDLTSLYAEDVLSNEKLKLLATFLSALHKMPINTTDIRLKNRAMRELNHEHIFHFPLVMKNGLDLDALTPGLSEVVNVFKADHQLVAEAHRLGALYLSESGRSLLHGDFYPGSWLSSSDQVFVIDPEFCFVGAPEFDLGVLAAHLILANQPRRLLPLLFETYRKNNSFDRDLTIQFAGIEIMRRLIGVAQLPLKATLPEKKTFLEISRSMVLSPQKEFRI